MLRPIARSSFFRSAKLLCLGIVAVHLVLRACAQDNEEQLPPGPTITLNARLLLIDVVVTDKSGKPVDGLTRNDFQVYEDNRPQSIRSFEPPSAHTLPSDSAGPATLFDPAQPKPFGQSPVTVLVLDQLNTHFADSSYARRELHDYLAAQPALLPQPTTLLTVYDNHFLELHGFTRDRDTLLRSLSTAPTKYAWNLEVTGSTEGGPLERLQESLEALLQIAQDYARIPGRKNLLWIGGGFPTPDPTTIDGDDAKEVKDTLQHVTDVLLDTRVTLYAVDPSSSAAGLTEITTIEQSNFAMAAGGLSAGIDPFNATEDFDRLGPVTGGRIVRGLNDVHQEIAAAVRLGDDYYTIGYEPTTGTGDGTGAYRHIRVECLRPGLTASTRDGYYPSTIHSQATANNLSYDLSTAAESTVPLNGLHVRVRPDADSGRETYIVQVSANDLTWSENSDGSLMAHVQLLAVYFSSKGKMLSHTLRAMTATAKSNINVHDPNRNADFTFTIRPVSHPGKLRFVVRDAATGRMGSFDMPNSDTSPSKGSGGVT